MEQEFCETVFKHKDVYSIFTIFKYKKNTNENVLCFKKTKFERIIFPIKCICQNNKNIDIIVFASEQNADIKNSNLA